MGRPKIPGLGRDVLASKPQVCLCGAINDRHAGSGHDGKPRAGDVTVCLHCAAVLRFANDLSLVPTTIEELPEEMRAPCREAVAKVLEWQRSEKS